MKIEEKSASILAHGKELLGKLKIFVLEARGAPSDISHPVISPREVVQLKKTISYDQLSLIVFIILDLSS